MQVGAYPTPVVPPGENALAELQRRVEELERGPTAVPPDLQHRIDALKARAAQTPGPAPVAHRVSSTYPPPVIPTAAYARMVSGAPPPALSTTHDIPVDIDVDSRFDGRARRRRVILRFFLFILIVFGGLVGAMVYSYSPQARVLLTH